MNIKMDDENGGSGGGNVFEGLGELLLGLGAFAVPAALDLNMGRISWIHEGELVCES